MQTPHKGKQGDNHDPRAKETEKQWWRWVEGQARVTKLKWRTVANWQPSNAVQYKVHAKAKEHQSKKTNAHGTAIQNEINDPPRWAYTTCVLENVLANQNRKQLLRDKSPHWAYGDCALEHTCSPNHIKSHCLGMMSRTGLLKKNIWSTCGHMMPRTGLIRTIIGRTCVRQTMLKTVALAWCPALRS